MRRKIVVPNIELLQDVARLIDSNERVILLTKGFSMLPFIVGGRDSVELTPLEAPIEVGDILLAKIAPSERYVIHRVVEVSDDVVTLMGDGNIAGRERCRPEDVVAKVTSIITPQGAIDPNTKSQRRNAHLWRILQPIRRYLLAILRRTLYAKYIFFLFPLSF